VLAKNLVRAFYGLLSLALPFVASCKLVSTPDTPDVSTPLSELDSKVTLSLETRPTGVGVYLLPSNPDSVNTDNCFGLKTNARAELNGEPVEVTDYGGIKHTRGGESYCVYPGFELDERPESQGESSVDSVRVWDDTAAFVMTVRDFTSTHIAEIAEPVGGLVALNETVTLASTPASEDVVTAILEFYSDNPTRTRENGTPLPEFTYDETKGPDGSGASTQFLDNTIRFAMGPSALGPGRLNGNLGLALPVEECTGPRECVVRFDYGFSELPVEVVP
jgi:hypothetical protein